MMGSWGRGWGGWGGAGHSGSSSTVNTDFDYYAGMNVRDLCMIGNPH